MKHVFLFLLICLFLESEAQRTERFTFHFDNGVCRRVEGVKKSKTISVIAALYGSEQRNRYDSWANSIGVTYDLRRDPNKGFSVGLELKHQYSSSKLKFRTNPISRFDQATLYSFDQRISFFTIGPSFKGTGKLFENEKLRLNYVLGAEAQVNFATQEHEVEFRRYKTNSYSDDFIALSELLDSKEYVERRNTYWISILTCLELTFKTEKRTTWGVRFYSDLWFGSPNTIAFSGTKWNYSDETGFGLIVRY